MKSVVKRGLCLLSMAILMGASAFAQVDSSSVAAENTQAENGPKVLSFTLDEAKKYAVEHNRTIQNASYDVQKAEAARWKAIASMLLQVNGEVDYYNFLGHEMELMGQKIAMPPYFNFGLTASFTVSGQQILGVRVAKMAKEMSEVATGKTEQMITSNIETSYVNILALENMVQLLEQNQANLDSVYKMTLNAVKVGVAEQNDADQLAVQVASLKSAVNNQKRTIEVLYNTIRLMTGATADDEIVLTQKLDDVVNPGSIMEVLNSDLDLNNNYDYQLQSTSTEMAKKQVTLAKMAYVPSLTAFYSLTKKKYCSDEKTMDMSAPNTVGMTLNVPIWSTGTRWADVKSAKCDYASSLNTLEDTKQQLGIQEKQLKYNLQSALENHEIQSNNIDVMLRVFKSNSEKFKYGTVSSMQLTTSSTDLISAQNTYLSALMEMVSAYVDLRILMNK